MATYFEEGREGSFHEIVAAFIVAVSAVVAAGLGVGAVTIVNRLSLARVENKAYEAEPLVVQNANPDPYHTNSFDTIRFSLLIVVAVGFGSLAIFLYNNVSYPTDISSVRVLVLFILSVLFSSAGLFAVIYGVKETSFIGRTDYREPIGYGVLNSPNQYDEYARRKDVRDNLIKMAISVLFCVSFAILATVVFLKLDTEGGPNRVITISFFVMSLIGVLLGAVVAFFYANVIIHRQRLSDITVVYVH